MPRFRRAEEKVVRAFQLIKLALDIVAFLYPKTKPALTIVAIAYRARLANVTFSDQFSLLISNRFI